jgi:hypothetical protein
MATDINTAQAKDLANARSIIDAAIEGNDIADEHLPEALQFMQRSAERMAEQRENLRKLTAEYKRSSNEPAKSTAAPAYLSSTGDSKRGIAGRFSFTRAICNVLEGRQQDGAEAEMIREGRSQFGAARGQIVVPDWGARELRDVYGSNASSGSIDAAVTGLQTLAGAPLRGALHGQPLAEKLGATIVDAQGSNTVLLPWLGVVNAASTAEGATTSADTADFQEVSLTPTRYSRKVTVSQLSLRTTGNGGNMDAILMNDMSNALATAQDKQAFAALQSAAQFALATENGTNGLEATDMDDIHALVSKYMDVTGRNEYPDLIVSKLGAAALNTGLSGTDTTLSERYVAQTGRRIIPAVNIVDGNFTATDIIDGAAAGTIAGAGVAMAGDMASLVIARWGGFDLLVDVYGANADGHLVSLHANAYSAAGVLNNAFAQLAVAPEAIAAT